jgi:putative transposase
MPTHRKNTRLCPMKYRGQQAYFVTICCDRRNPHLASPSTAERTLQILLESATAQSFQLHAFCLMPDHVHILAGGLSDVADLRRFILLFKQRTAYEFYSTHHQRLWQKSYYDRILRPSDNIEDVARYIWWNPVRKLLCAEPRDFRFSGSQTIDWKRRSSTAPMWSPWPNTKEPA